MICWQIKMNSIVLELVIAVGLLHWSGPVEATVENCFIQALTETKDMEIAWEVPEAAKLISEFKEKEDGEAVGPWINLANLTLSRHGAQWIFDLEYVPSSGLLVVSIDANYSASSSKVPNAIQARVEIKDTDNSLSKKKFWGELHPYGNTTDAWHGYSWISIRKNIFTSEGSPLSLIIKARISSADIEVDKGSDSKCSWSGLMTSEALTGSSSTSDTMPPRIVLSWTLGNPGSYFADSKQINSLSELGILNLMNEIVPVHWSFNARLWNFGDFKSIELELNGYSLLDQYVPESFQINATVSGGSVAKPMTDLSRYLVDSKRVDVNVTDQCLDEFKSKMTFQIVFDPIPQQMA